MHQNTYKRISNSSALKSHLRKCFFFYQVKFEPEIDSNQINWSPKTMHVKSTVIVVNAIQLSTIFSPQNSDVTFIDVGK